MDDKMNDVINEVQKKLGEEYEVKRVEVMKNNDTKLKEIQVRRKIGMLQRYVTGLVNQLMRL